MTKRIARWIGHEVLLRDIGDILGFGVFREEMIERLILARPGLFGDRSPMASWPHRLNEIKHCGIHRRPALMWQRCLAIGNAASSSTSREVTAAIGQRVKIFRRASRT